MNDEQIVELYWARSETAIAETEKKYGRYCRYIAFRILQNDEDAKEIVNDTYLKTSGDKVGIASYGQVCDLLVNWHYQTVVLPGITESVKIFDPYNENQVDLSGIVNAKKPDISYDENPGGIG